MKAQDSMSTKKAKKSKRPRSRLLRRKRPKKTHPSS
ncbi:unnamed protein product [Tuber melanosporum]|uniref:(Perigord truffle) hypothetical protein n=1 Tax=Tuber melanosporum (strain Mel28) TaxID=656061 RepID=D5GFP4_TUBMM|nr:uncharacterized protein GSTUM_00001903001 [Tuber melanosporum]CAZ83337.1 unnamed protein product [Tuber melanosporum]